MSQISIQIERYKQKNDLTYVDAFITFCEERELDYEELIHEIAVPLRKKIENEFIRLNMVKERKRLSVFDDFL